MFFGHVATLTCVRQHKTRDTSPLRFPFECLAPHLIGASWLLSVFEGERRSEGRIGAETRGPRRLRYGLTGVGGGSLPLLGLLVAFECEGFDHGCQSSIFCLFFFYLVQRPIRRMKFLGTRRAPGCELG